MDSKDSYMRDHKEFLYSSLECCNYHNAPCYGLVMLLLQLLERIGVCFRLKAPLSLWWLINRVASLSPPPHPTPQQTHPHTQTHSPLQPPSTLPWTPSAPSYRPHCVCVFKRESMSGENVSLRTVHCICVHMGVSRLFLTRHLVQKGGRFFR